VKPYVILHNAVSLDGRINNFPLNLELYYGLAAGFGEDATLAGCDTLLAGMAKWLETEEEAIASSTDDSKHPETRPLLVVPDSRGRMKAWERLLRQPYWRGGVSLCTDATPGEHREYLTRVGVEALSVGERHVDYPRALEELGRRLRVKYMRMDSGGTLNGLLLREGLIDEISLLVHPTLVGDTDPGSIFHNPDPSSPASPVSLDLKSCQTLEGGYLWLRFLVKGTKT